MRDASHPSHRRCSSKARNALSARFAVAAALGLAFAACAAPGTRPADMSVPDHIAAAEDAEAAADAHAQQYDPDAWNAPSHCGEFCFSTWTNPTAEHAREARKHRRLAERHRQASEALRLAEEASCTGIPTRDRDISPFFHAEDILEVKPEGDAEWGSSRFTIRFVAVPGVDADRMQRLIDCHLARSAARGHVAPEMPYCPLVPRGVSARTRSSGDALEVTLTVDEPESREEVAMRLHELASVHQAS